ncbi:iron-sulfur cluster assembly scaffold protein [Alienimonas chondri]|uniref:NIF system FeS cluster assembly NifU N-terminal domain-containing protein n=1 Tax=Alienimonas chondri TaxID=2681879 RepID=A0ABX1VHG5_9PLAN|nr:iron-sulfur cluster assembly scaffold protein [Alienimonas chondri]NNJ26206.1 hypothetical protein [Alienimonas chondri]
MFDHATNAEDVQDLLLDHEESPRNRGRAIDATHTAVRRHPLCGDEVAVTVRVKDGRATEVRWEGRGCVLCRASASLTCEAAEGRPVAELSATDDAELVHCLGLPLSPAKRICATLPLTALRAALAIRKHFPPEPESSSASSCAPS